MRRISFTLLIVLVATLSLNIADTNIVITDTTPPDLVNFEVSPLAIDTSTGNASVSVRIEASDNFTGFGAGTGSGNGSIQILSPSGQPVGRATLPITGGTSLEPIFEFDLVFPQFSEQGTWDISLVLVDNLFNASNFSSDDLAKLGFPSTIEVTSIEDSTPPRLLNFEVTPLSINTTNNSATISVRIEAEDDISGFGSGGMGLSPCSSGNSSLRIDSPSGQPVMRDCLPITGGTNLAPIFEFDLEFPQFSETGTWEITLTLVDKVFNSLLIENTDLFKLGFPSTVEVTSLDDSTPPALINFEVNPLVVNTVDGSSKICIRVESRDDMSGFQTGSIMVESPSGQPVGLGSIPVTGGTNLEPVSQFELEFPQFSEPGIWDISLELVDNVFNTSMFSANNLANLGFPSTVEVTTDSVPDPQPCFPPIGPTPTPPSPTASPTPTASAPPVTPTPSPTASPSPTSSPDPEDKNNDGVPDDQQDNVETIQVEDGSLTVETGNGTTIINFTSAVNLINQSPLPPANLRFLGIFFGFEITNVQVGGSTQARLIFENPFDFDVYYKFGSTPTNPVPHWYEFNYDGETGARRLANGEIILHFVDGKRGDNDLTANGRIVDPGGPAVFRNQPPQGDDSSGGGGCSLSEGSTMTQSIFNLLFVFVPVLFLLLVRIAKHRFLPILRKTQ